jgi:hypothetical protein
VSLNRLRIEHCNRGAPARVCRSGNGPR